MSTRVAASRPIIINGNKVAATLAQVGSFATTWLCVRALGYTGADGFVIAVFAEFILAAGKFSLLHGRGDFLGVIALVLDAALNAGGLWPVVQRFDETPTAIMLSQALGLEAQMRSLPALFFAFLFGLLLSALPHWLWARK